MNLMPIPCSFIQERASLSWREVLWGYEHQMIGSSDVVKLAQIQLRSDSDACEIELSSLDESDTYRIGELLSELAASEPERTGSMSDKKWLYLTLAWALDNKEQFDDPLGEVEMIYADFDYPRDIESFVRYMPVTDGYDLGRHSKEYNEDLLFRNWKNYVDAAQRVVGFSR